MTIAIVGLGYVGLPLCLQFARSGVKVIGLDVDAKKVRALNAGRSYIQHIPSGEIKKFVRAKKFSASTNFSLIKKIEFRRRRGHESQIKIGNQSEIPYVASHNDKTPVAAVLICVPTPLKKNREPDLSYVLKTGKSIAPHLQKGMLVVLESTTYPGTTENELRGVLERGSGLKAGRDFHLAYSPEREDPGNPKSKVSEIPKIIGGFTPACLEKAKTIYSKAIRKLVPVSNCRTAEATKLLENIFRSVNIALVNELKTVYDAMDIDVWEVIAAAKTKPFGFMPFYPGPGLGGHCIPIDPFYLAWRARQFGQETRFVKLAGEINTAMPEKIVAQIGKILESQKKSLRGAKILILGLAYKANVDDDRESPSYVLMDLLKARDAKVFYFDPHIPIIRPSREHSHWAGTKSVKWNRKTISKFDAVLIATAHEAIDFQNLADWSQLIVDTRNAMAGIETAAEKIWKA